MKVLLMGLRVEDENASLSPGVRADRASLSPPPSLSLNQPSPSEMRSKRGKKGEYHSNDSAFGDEE